MIELRHLRYFVAVAEELHFGRAADRLHMAQSPLSQQIRQLERQLDVPLLERSRRSVALTQPGSVFLDGARAVLAELDHAVHAAQRAARGEIGELCVGFVSEVTSDLLPISLRTFKQQFPDVTIELREAPTGVQLESLLRGAIDVAFIRPPAPVAGLEYEGIIQEELLAAVPDGHHAGVGRRPLADLAGEPFVMPTAFAAAGMRKDILAACQAAGFTPTVTQEASPLAAVLLLVAAGVGVALIPASVAHQFPVPGVRYVNLLGPGPVTTAGIAWRPGESSPPVQAFVAITRALARGKAGETDVWPERHFVTPPPSSDFA